MCVTDMRLLLSVRCNYSFQVMPSALGEDASPITLIAYTVVTSQVSSSVTTNFIMVVLACRFFFQNAGMTSNRKLLPKQHTL